MKIEKLDENTFRCVIEKYELSLYHITVENMAYGSENTMALFSEMLARANDEFGFTLSKSLMIEAIPLKEGSIELVVTKVDMPDELDIRFSKFSPSKQLSNFPGFYELLESAFDRLDNELKMQNLQGLQNINKDTKVNIDMRKEDCFICIFTFENIDKVSDGCKRINNIDF